MEGKTAMKLKNSQCANVRCPLGIDECAKQVKSYHEGQEQIWCCDDLCTNIKGQLKKLGFQP